MFKKSMMTTILLLGLSSAAQAEVVTFGHLSSDAQYDVIADTNLGREYLRFDTFEMTYAQTVTATSTGGLYEGWSVANSDISDQFINGLFGQNGENVCSSGEYEIYQEVCGTLTGWTDGIFGDARSGDRDTYAYVSTHETLDRSGAVGLGRILNSVVDDLDSWGALSSVDSLEGINFLLYRENTSHIGGFNAYAAANNVVTTASDVSAPLSSGAMLLAMGLLGFSLRSKKQIT